MKLVNISDKYWKIWDVVRVGLTLLRLRGHCPIHIDFNFEAEHSGWRYNSFKTKVAVVGSNLGADQFVSLLLY